MARENTGCFAWCISFKKSVNERWARFRNRLRRRFYARRGEAVDPSTLLNETGTRDIVLSKTPYKTNKIEPSYFPVNINDVPVNTGVVQTNGADREFNKLVEGYVSGIIREAADRLLSETQHLPSNKEIITENAADDNVSLSSSIISQMADTAVTESLTNILMGSDKNQSARNAFRPKTVKELIEMLGIVEQSTAGDSLCPVSE